MEHEKNSSRVILRNIGSSVLSLLGAMVLSFVISWLLARLLDNEIYGQYVFMFNTFGLILSFSDMGLSKIITREIARSRDAAGQFVQTAVLIRLTLTLLTVIAALLVILTLDQLEGQEILALIVVFTLVITNFSDLLRSVFLGFERMELDLVTRVAERALTLVIVILLSLVTLTLETAVWGLLAGAVIGLLLTLLYLWKLITPQFMRFNRGFSTLMLRAGLPMGGSILLVSFYSRFDVLLIGILRTSQEVAWFSIAYSFILILVSISFAASGALLPAFSRYQGIHLPLLKESLRYTLIAGMTAAVCIFIGAETLILTIYGSSYAPSVGVLQLFGFTLVFIFPTHLMLNLLLSVNKQTAVFQRHLLSALLLLILDPFLIMLLGIQGAALANILVEATVFGLYLALIRKHTGSLFFRPILRVFAAGGAAFAAYLLLPASAVFQILITVVVYLAAVFAFRCLTLDDLQRLGGMMPFGKRLKYFVPVAVLMMLFTIPVTAQAQEPTSPIRIPAVLLGEGDMIRVYDDGNGIADFHRDTWVFDVGDDGSAQLVIRFSSYPNITVAQIYVDHNNNGTVDILIEDNEVRVIEPGSSLPVIRVIANGDWFLPDGRLNWNIRFQTDGAILYDENENIPASIELLNTIASIWTPFLVRDGEPDMEFEFLDTNNDGIPEYHLWRLLINTPSRINATRSRLWANSGQYEPVQPQGFNHWPFLVSKTAAPDVISGGTNYFDIPPFIQIDWTNGKVTPPLFHGYPIEHGFHVHNLEYLEKGKVNYANFEIAQAYYDLAQDRDSLPELHIRHRYFDAWDPKAWNLPSPINEIRYSWNQSDVSDLSWDFRLGLGGRYPVVEETIFPDFTYRSVPYDDLPQWVTTRDWDISVLVAAETFRYPSSEGIYEWAPVEAVPLLDEELAAQIRTDEIDFRNSLLSRMLSGQEYNVDIPATFESLIAGMRGEISYTSSHRPYLYFSPVDQKLHLSFADYGIWNFEEGGQQRIYNLNGDETLDQWIYLLDGDVQRQMLYADPYLIYAGEDEVLLKHVEIEPAAFQTLPPTTHTEWLALKNRLEAAQGAADIVQGEYRPMFEQFSGKVQRFASASISDVRAFDGGIRFVLDLHDAPQHGLDPGLVVVSIPAGGTVSFLPLTPPALTFSMEPLPVRERTSTQLQLRIGNNGLKDAHNTLIELYARQQSQTVLIHTEGMDINAGEERILRPIWKPQNPGEWELFARVTQDAVWDDEQWISEREAVQIDAVTVDPIQVAEADLLLSLNQELPLNGIPILIIMGCLAISASALFVLIAKNMGRSV